MLVLVEYIALMLHKLASLVVLQAAQATDRYRVGGDEDREAEHTCDQVTCLFDEVEAPKWRVNYHVPEGRLPMWELIKKHTGLT